ncbi:MAG TPA: hypothetical protein VKU60_04510, partial [Chloroflexota bacterium]|nr:hypothetical protein [Chloroflexota bacterium]
LFLLVAGQFFWVTPILEGPDSYQHFKFVRYLLVDHRFPSLNDPDPANAPYQEAAQYPLYYLLGAAVSFPVSTADFDQVVAHNPHAGDPRGNGNGNFLFHRPFSGFPRGTELAARLVGLLSLACGLVTVACASFLGWLAAPKSRCLPFAAGAVLAADPPFAAFSSYVTNDDLVAALSSVTILLLVSWLINGARRWSWLAAAALSLAVLAKFSAIGLVIPFLLAVVLVEHGRQARILQVAKLGLFVTVVDGWWMVRDQVLNGDFTSMLAVNGHAAKQDFHPFAAPLAGIRQVVLSLPSILHGLFATGAYGIDSPPGLYVPTTVLGVVGLTAGVVIAIRRMKKQPWLGLVLVWPALNLALLVAYGGNIAVPGARLLFPSIACLAVLAALGWSSLLAQLRLLPVGWLLGAAGVSVALLVPRLVVAPAFAYPPTFTELPASATPVQATFAGAVDLIGAESDAPTYVQPGMPYHLALYWRLRRPVDKPLDTFVHVDALGPGYTSDASYDGAVGGGTYPPNFWQEGQIVVDRYTFLLAPDTRPDKRNALPLAVHAGMYDETNGKVPTEPPAITDTGVQVALWKLPGQPPSIPAEPPLASFPGGLDLQAAQTSLSEPAVLSVNLRWSAAARPERDFTVFVHVISPDGKVLAQHDSYPLDGRYSTTEWSAGEQVLDTVSLPLKQPLAQGDRVLVGLYVLPNPRAIRTVEGDDAVIVPLDLGG